MTAEGSAPTLRLIEAAVLVLQDSSPSAQGARCSSRTMQINLGFSEELLNHSTGTGTCRK